MLHEIQLLVAGRYPEILPVVGKVFLFLLACFVGKGHAALFAERRIGEHIIISCFRSGDQRIIGRDERFAIDVADVVQEQMVLQKAQILEMMEEVFPVLLLLIILIVGTGRDLSFYYSSSLFRRARSRPGPTF